VHVPIALRFMSENYLQTRLARSNIGAVCVWMLDMEAYSRIALSFLQLQGGFCWWKSWYSVNFYYINVSAKFFIESLLMEPVFRQRCVYFDSDNYLGIFYSTPEPKGQNTHQHQKPSLIAQLIFGK
jgi:hypothetical protein